MKKRIDVINIGNRCKRFRIEIGISQIDVANDLGLTQGMVSRFENGRVDSLYIFKWYLEHGITVEYLLEDEYNG